jgi:tetratricopeptide (TPR) repeat protein
MTSAAALLDEGAAAHRQGRLAAAEAAYRRALELVPDHAPALHLLGLVAYQRRRWDEAIQYLSHAVERHAGEPAYRNNLALALLAAGRLAAAEASARAAVALDPAYVPGHISLAIVLRAAGRPGAAEGACRAAIALDPLSATARCQLGHALNELGRLDDAIKSFQTAERADPRLADAMLGQAAAQRALGRDGEAVECYRRALALHPGDPRILNALGTVWRRLGRRDTAVECYRAALAGDPAFADAHNNLGAVLADSGAFEPAAASFQAALERRPDDAGALSNLGAALFELDRLDEAEACHRRAVALGPDLAAVHCNFANLLTFRQRLDEAERHYRRAVALAPDYGDAWHNLGVVQAQRHDLAAAEASYRAARNHPGARDKADYGLAELALLTGDLAEGWARYESRLNLPGGGDPDPGLTRWDGAPIAGGAVLLQAEQGFGDTLQFCRYVRLAAERARVVLQVPPELQRLLAVLPGLAEIVPFGAPLPPVACRSPLMSLPHLFGTELATIPGTVPYLRAGMAQVEPWRRRLAALEGRRVGLVWAGGIRPGQPRLKAVDARRSIGLAALAPLAAIEGVHFVSLQKGPAASQAEDPPDGMVLHDFTAELGDFADTAALIEALDLVIGVDTAVVHLAGALGKPVWLLNRFDTCWRWLLDRDDSPWYPSLRQFRQPAPGDWTSVVARVAAALAALGR